MKNEQQEGKQHRKPGGKKAENKGETWAMDTLGENSLISRRPPPGILDGLLRTISFGNGTMKAGPNYTM